MRHRSCDSRAKSPLNGRTAWPIQAMPGTGTERPLPNATQIPADRLMAIIVMQNAIARSPADLDSVMSVVVDQAMTLTGATGAVVEVVDGDKMLDRSASGAAAAFIGFKIARAGSLSGLCITERIVLQAGDTATDDRVDRAACQRVGVASMVCVPLVHDGEPVGVLKIMSDRRHAFDGVASATVALLADVIAAAM